MTHNLDKLMLYPLAAGRALEHPGMQARWTGEFRQPKKGEWFISGTDPAAYQAQCDLPHKHYIAALVSARPITLTETAYWHLVNALETAHTLILRDLEIAEQDDPGKTFIADEIAECNADLEQIKEAQDILCAAYEATKRETV